MPGMGLHFFNTRPLSLGIHSASSPYTNITHFSFSLAYLFFFFALVIRKEK
jgi:hypothetical protein